MRPAPWRVVDRPLRVGSDDVARQARRTVAGVRPQSGINQRLMRSLLALPLVLAAATAHAQYGGYPQSPPALPAPPRYAPYPPANPTYGPPTEGYFSARPGGSPRSLAYQTLAPQNAVRSAVGDPPLRWSDRLAAAAQAWADHLIAAGQFAHRRDDSYGENLYQITGGSATPQQVVGAWADEAHDYDISTNTCTASCGHFTQIVWRSTHGVGCGVAGSADREVWVCEYYPPGNVVGYRPY